LHGQTVSLQYDVKRDSFVARRSIIARLVATVLVTIGAAAWWRLASPYGTNSRGGKTPALLAEHCAERPHGLIAFDSDSATNYMVLW
jgi:hypothetical protein